MAHKPKEHEKYNRFSWLLEHPEDKPLDEENQRVRKKGFEDDDARNLMAAICLRACIDYKAASTGVEIDGYLPEKTLKDCHEFFQSEMFQYFAKGMPATEVEKLIRSTPKGQLHILWKESIK